MPAKLATPCAYRGCAQLTHERYCSTHKKEKWKGDDARKETTEAGQRDRRFYSSATWQRLRTLHIRGEPLCRECGSAGEVVDHIKPISQGGDRFNPINLQTLCNQCHNRKRQRERINF